VVLSGLLFFGWIGYLFFLVQIRPQAPGGGPVVLSRPQFLISELDVIAHVESLKGPVIVKEVIFPRTPGRSRLVGQRIFVTNLYKCHRLPGGRKEDEGKVPDDFKGPGDYILALCPTGLARGATLAGLAANPSAGMLLTVSQPPVDLETAISFEVVPTPPSPGFPPLDLPSGPPRIYPRLSATEAQLKQIENEKAQ